MKKSVLEVISQYGDTPKREIRTSEYEELEEMLREKGSMIALTSAYYFGYIQALKEKGVIR